MLRALQSVRARLSDAALTGVLFTETHPLGDVEPIEEEALRVSLWQSIAGRDAEQSPEVLQIRLAICLLYAGSVEPPEAAETLEYFEYAFRAAELPESALSTLHLVQL